MGCSQSKIENEEAVSRCKERKTFMKTAVNARNAFAAAHVAYAMSLKNAGAALTDFAQGEAQIGGPTTAAGVVGTTNTTIATGVKTTGGGVGSTTTQPPPPPPIGNLPPPPPPVPDMPPPLQRAVSMPEFVVSKPGPKPEREDTIDEEEDEGEEEEEEEEEEDLSRLRRRGRRENKGGSVGGRIEMNENGGVVGPPPPPEVIRERSGTPPPPPPLHSMSSIPGVVDGGTWDFFFNSYDMPGGSLRDVDETEYERESRVVYQQRAMRGGGTQGAVMVAENPKVEVVEEMVMMPPMGAGGGGGGGRVLKKGKQGGSSGGDGRRKSVSLVQIFGDLDDCFLKASESAHQVSKMLEATRLHYHSNFADNRGKEEEIGKEGILVV